MRGHKFNQFPQREHSDEEIKEIEKQVSNKKTSEKNMTDKQKQIIAEMNAKYPNLQRLNKEEEQAKH